MSINELEQAFPLLRTSRYTITSQETDEYNCIAWAAGDTVRWWWPTSPPSYWPTGIPLEESIDAFIQVFATLGYDVCNNPDLEPGFEKIAIYSNARGIPRHAARQLSDGTWTSKLGGYVDINHELISLTGLEYGTIARILKRSII